MRSFAAIATFAALAFSAVTSALPTSAPYTTGATTDATTGVTTGGAQDVDVSTIDLNAIVRDINVVVENSASTQINLLNLGGTQNNQGGSLHLPIGDSHPQSAPGPKGIPDVLVGVNAKVFGLVKDLTAKITADIDVDAALELSLDCFGQIKAILEGAIADIQVIVSGDVNVALYLGGKAQDVKVVAELLGGLLKAVVLALGLAVKVCISIDISALLAIVVDIAGVLSVIVGLVVKVAADVVVELQTAIQVILHVVVGLRLSVLANVLGISL